MRMQVFIASNLSVCPSHHHSTGSSQVGVLITLCVPHASMRAEDNQMKSLAGTSRLLNGDVSKSDVTENRNLIIQTTTWEIMPHQSCRYMTHTESTKCLRDGYLK